MLTAVIEDLADVNEALQLADALEFRLDKTAPTKVPLPTIFTVKGNSHKTHLQPDYFDIDFADAPPSGHKIIRSYHGHTFPKTLFKGDIIKIAVHGTSTLDALKCLSMMQENRMIAISMGDRGVISRILGPRFGAPFTYGYVNHPTAPGQLSLKEHRDKYRVGPNTKIYGLIGTRVEQSPSDVTHNRFFQEKGIDAVYVKMIVEPQELPAFLNYMRRLPFEGLSVTVSLKEEIIQHLDEIDEEAKAIGAVNTLTIKNGHIKGYNTDGIGALNSLGFTKQLTILGAGGTARAIAYEAKKRGIEVSLKNRTESRGKMAALELGVAYGELNGKVINTTPIEYSTAYDVDLTRSSPFAFAMFHAQANEQFRLWNLL